MLSKFSVFHRIKKSPRFNKWRSRAPDPLTFLSGALIVLAFPPWNLWPLLWICLVPWLGVLRRTPTFRAAIQEGLWLSYFVSLGGFYWVTFAVSEFGNIPFVVCLFFLQFFCFLGQLQFPVYALLEKKFAAAPFLLQQMIGPITMALAYAGLDWFLPKIFHDTLGHALYQARHLRQLAEVGGVYLITFLIVLANFTLANLFEFIWPFRLKLEVNASPKRSAHPNFTQASNLGSDPRTTSRIKITPANLVAQSFVLTVALAVAWIYGYRRNQEILQKIADAPRTLQVAAIQGNIGDMNKLAAENGIGEAAAEIIDTYTGMTEEALKLHPKPHLIIWPETAYPSTFRHPHTSAEFRMNARIEYYARQMGVPLLFGGYDEYQEQDYNAFFYFKPDGKMHTYRKNILLLFGEYIPGAESIPLIKKTFPQVGNFGRGVGPEILTTDTAIGSIATSPIICYEVLFPYFLLETARNGSQLIINITNDSWFGNWGEPQLHLALATFRSIETRLPMLRSTNTGITALVLPNGEIVQATPINVKQILNVGVPLLDPPIDTLLKRWGDWFGLFALLTGLLGFCLMHHPRFAHRI